MQEEQGEPQVQEPPKIEKRPAPPKSEQPTKKLKSIPSVEKTEPAETVNTPNEALSKYKSKLKSGQFRWINELMYTKPSEKAKEIFDKDPSLFEEVGDHFLVPFFAHCDADKTLLQLSITKVFANRWKNGPAIQSMSSSNNCRKFRPRKSLRILAVEKQNSLPVFRIRCTPLILLR
jgi:hypothetical protein